MGTCDLYAVYPRVDQGSFFKARRSKVSGINIDIRTRSILEEERNLQRYSNDTFFEYLDISRHLF